jgi:hypothetical protein
MSTLSRSIDGAECATSAEADKRIAAHKRERARVAISVFMFSSLSLIYYFVEETTFRRH